MKKHICVLLALIAITFAAAERSDACSCVVSRASVKKQVAAAYKASSAIFSGKVLSATDNGTDFVIVTLMITERWKAGAGAEIKIKTPKDSAMCGFDFEVGKEYLVYANGTAADLSVYNCSRTTLLSGSADIKYLANLKRKNAGGK